MSLTELADLFGNMGAAVRTGPISGHNVCPACKSKSVQKQSTCPRCRPVRRVNKPVCPHCRVSPCSCPRRVRKPVCPRCRVSPCSCHRKQECHHCGSPANPGRPCNCQQSPVISRIREINKAPASDRNKGLMDLLKFQTAVLGLIVSRQTNKCIGAIDHKGTIKHCDAKDAVGPYNIIIKPTTNDSIATRGPNERVLGQCVGPKGNTLAEIVRKNKTNRISLARESTAPVMAIVVPSVSAPEKHERTDTLDTLVRESKALLN